MNYYNTKKELTSFSLEVSKNHGTCGSIYPIEKDLCLKKYYTYTSMAARMDFPIFQFLKNLNSLFTNTILDLYYEEENVLKNKSKPISTLQTDAYLFQFLEEEKRNILNESVEYLLYNLQELEKLMDIFSENKIKVDDLKKDNCVFFENRIVLIDLDNCKFCKKRIDLRVENRDRLRLLFISLFKESSFVIFNKKIEELWKLEEKKSLTESVSRKLAKYKTPMDYFKTQ